MKITSLLSTLRNEFQLSDNAHESRLKEVIEKYLRNNNYSLGGTEVHAASDLMEKLDVSGKIYNYIYLFIFYGKLISKEEKVENLAYIM